MRYDGTHLLLRDDSAQFREGRRAFAPRDGGPPRQQLAERGTLCSPRASYDWDVLVDRLEARPLGLRMLGADGSDLTTSYAAD